jgi:L-amino acid N-acyltransferase YncA
MAEPTDRQIRTLEPADEPALLEFASAIPNEDRNFLKEDIADPATLRSWLTDTHALRLIAEDGAGIIHGIAAVIPGVGRAGHVAELRVVVAAAHRGHGVGRSLARRAMLEAFKRDVHKLMVDVTAEDEATINLFTSIGFRGEALLRDQLRDPDGALHDVLIFAHTADDNWPELLTAGVGDELG